MVQRERNDRFVHFVVLGVVENLIVRLLAFESRAYVRLCPIELEEQRNRPTSRVVDGMKQ